MDRDRVGVRGAGAVTRWLPVPGYEYLYEVSDDGQVRRNGRVLKMQPSWSGHLFVSLSRYSHKKNVHVGRLVLLTFIGPAPDGTECRHYPDQNPSNNRLENLSWATRRTNVLDKIEHGTDNFGERHGMAILTWEMVRKIRSDTTSTQAMIAKRFGVSQSTISKVLRGEYWRESRVR